MSETPFRRIALNENRDDLRPRWYLESRMTEELLRDDAALRRICASMIPPVVKRETALVETLTVYEVGFDPDTKSYPVIVTGRGDAADE